MQFAQMTFSPRQPCRKNIFCILSVFLLFVFLGRATQLKKKIRLKKTNLKAPKNLVTITTKKLITNGAESLKRTLLQLVMNSIFTRIYSVLLCFSGNFKHFRCYCYFFQFPFITVRSDSQEKGMCEINVDCFI